MSNNRFAYCDCPEQVLWAYRSATMNLEPNSHIDADALARIRELTPPEKPVVSEEARERAWESAGAQMQKLRLRPTGEWFECLLDSIIDALGYTAATDDVVSREPARSVSTEELIAVLGAHIYGDRGPFTDHPHRFSVCTRAAEDLVVRYRVLRIGGEQ